MSRAACQDDDRPVRLGLEVEGVVQGVGFRPHVHHLARTLGLNGWVVNTPRGARLEVEGKAESVRQFRHRLSAPAPGRIERVRADWLPCTGEAGFEIRHSHGDGAVGASVLPDLAICADCLAELQDPENRRHRYPFITCSHCGPRWSILRALPYDRPNTSMAGFPLCPACRAEYDDPADRRFHAQPIACPDCGPQLELWNAAGSALARREAALQAAVAALGAGAVLALKGIGGFQLLCDARDATAVAALRRRKRRGAKPFALMVEDLAAARALVELGPLERDLLASPQAPIVLARRQPTAAVAEAVAPGNPYLGVMLACSPLHHLLLAGFGAPLVATSGNLGDEPLCADEAEALRRLAGIADLFLVHDRPILRPVDDSVVQVVAGRPAMLRRARGYAPLPLGLPACRESVLAVGAQQKNTVALALGGSAVLSPHLGDLGSAASAEAFKTAIDGLQQIYRRRPWRLAHDVHPDYASSQYARASGLPLVPVQHHHAHVAAVMAEHGLSGPVLGIAWDGSGLGDDGTLWGGEFLRVEGDHFQRLAHLRAFPLPGGDAAAREPRRAALGLLHEHGGGLDAYRDLPPARDCSEAEWRVLGQMLRRRLRCPRTSSVGRLFDAVAALLDLAQVNAYEGDAAMRLQFAAEVAGTVKAYPLPLREAEPAGQLDWAPLLAALLADRAAGVAVPEMAARFHAALLEGMLRVARRAGLPRIVLSGGCFQNRLLLEGGVTILRGAGFEVYWPQQLPANDGGIALGQAAVACARARRETGCV